jgi:predicted nucleic acid-binding Zn finger protein
MEDDGKSTDAILTRPPQCAGVTAVDEWEQQLTAAGELTPDVADRIISVHGDRGKRAMEAVAEDRVKEYRDFIVVVGHEDEYVVEDDGCTCKDAEYNLDPTDPEQLCWHAIAVRIARALEETDEHDMWYSDVRDFL